MRATSRRVSAPADLPVGMYTPTPGLVFETEVPKLAPAEPGTLWRAVRRAADSIRNVPADMAPPSDLIPGDGGDALDVLCAAWRQAYNEGRASFAGATLPGRPTLDRLRAAFLKELCRLPERADFAEAVRMLAALELVRDRLEKDEAQKFRRTFAGPAAMDLVVEVAHDMRSPLTAILLLTDTLRNAQPERLDPIAQRQVGLVYSAAFGLHAMVSDVIELARGGECLIEPEPMSFSIGEILQAAGDIVRPIAEEKKLRLTIVGPEVDARVGQPRALNRVLVNLTTNALKFTQEGEVRVVVRARSRTAVEFVVEDTGVGIPPDVMASLFEPFRWLRRGARVENTFSSAGLGLAICQRLVRSMGSELHVETEIGKGTKFSFEVALPVTAQEL